MRSNKLAWSAALLVGCIVTIGAMAKSASADLLVYEPFAYADGSTLTGQGGALGTTGTWTAFDSVNTNNWWVHQEGTTAGIVVDPGPPVVRNMFDGTVDNLPTAGGYAGLPGPADAGEPDLDRDFEIGRYMTASIALAPSVTATFTSGATTWFSFVTARGWDRNEQTPHFIIGTDTTPDGNRGIVLSNSGSGIGGGGGAPRDNRTDIFPQYYSGGLMNNALGTSDGTGFNSIPELPDATHTMPWEEFNPDGSFGPPNIVVGKIQWDADTGGEDIISVVGFLETDTLDEAAFAALIALKPGLSSANWASNKPDLDQSQFDTIDLSGTKVFVDEIRIGTTFADVVGGDAGLEGDVDLNGVVDINDYFLIRDNFLVGTTRGLGDLNFSGLVEFGDFSIWKTAFEAAPAAVPEPSGLLLLAAGAAGLAMWRRRRSDQDA